MILPALVALHIDCDSLTVGKVDRDVNAIGVSQVSAFANTNPHND
jgi:hypothetical protein